jgi:hypothetical protein
MTIHREGKSCSHVLFGSSACRAFTLKVSESCGHVRSRLQRLYEHSPWRLITRARPILARVLVLHDPFARWALGSGCYTTPRLGGAG